jgi:glycosyltransferase involved in cell wall biosynthesis
MTNADFPKAQRNPGRPLLSVVIPAWNRAESLPRAIGSVFDQGRYDLEVIVIDDASTDHTQEVVGGLEDDRIRYRRLEKQSGPSVTRNIAIEMARAPLIALLDSDDEWLPGKLDRQLALFGPGLDAVDVVYSGYQIHHADGHVETVLRPPPRSLRRALLGGNVFGCTSSVIVRRDVLDSVGGFDPSLPALVDYDLWLRLAVKGVSFASIPDPLVRFHKDRSDRVSADLDRRIKAQEIFLEKHLKSNALKAWERRKLLGGRLTQRGQEIAGAGRVSEGLGYVLKGLFQWPFNALSWYHLLRSVRGAVGGSNRGF